MMFTYSGSKRGTGYYLLVVELRVGEMAYPKDRKSRCKLT